MIQHHRLHDVHALPAADRGLGPAAGWWDPEWPGHESSGPTRNLQDEIRARSAPYYIPSRTRSSATGPNTENPTLFPRDSFPSEFSPPLDYFPHMSSQSIHGSTFNVIRGNVNSIQHQGESARQFLHRIGACDAFHNSAERFPQPKCHPETRTKMLDRLWDWTRGIERPWTYWDEIDWAPREHRTTRIIWLHGPAGAGKSAIAQSLCQKLEAEDRLVASFFFKREHASRGNATRLFATIAYQLAALPGFNSIISRNLANDPAVVDKSFLVQFEKLIIEPCRLANSASPPIVIIDGLDECEGRHVQEEILRSFANPILSPLPVYLLIASRPEPHISETFQETSLKGQHRRVNVDQSFEDVRKYLRDEFTRIHTNHRQTMANISSPWPSSSVMDELVEKSSGYFVYASTVIKFVDDKNYRPSDRLDVVTGLAEPDSRSPFAALDQLYSQILSRASAHPQLLHILAVIATKFFLALSPLNASWN
ncbi:hypothetical protein B0H14DRAFT_2524431 [Mycena olivaceomarginata]|nr:hypothetical protein B0H14DRAFT_2524431 [Mycena olivaceomarginata]